MTQIFRRPSIASGLDRVGALDGGIHDALRKFPGALAVVNRTGKTILTNDALNARYGKITVDPDSVERILWDLGGECRIRLRSRHTDTTVDVPALAIRLHDEYVLVLGDTQAKPDDDEFSRLRQLVDELEITSSTDHLTGAWNRAHFDHLIAVEIARCVDRHQPLSLILFDIDFFKPINDKLGHLTGDQVLRECVQVIRSQLRQADELFRWGGEEFAVLLEGCGYRAAERRAESMRVAVERHNFAGVGRITISAGVAEFRNGELPADWFERSDQALYTAKRDGRNRVITDRSGNTDDWAQDGHAATLHLEWSEAFESGDPHIDEQHAELFELANAALDAALNPGEGILQSLEQLIGHVQVHFSDEEALLARLGYAELDRHARCHAGLIRAAARLHRQASEGHCQLGELVEFLAQQVVARHLMVEDRKFFPLIRQATSPHLPAATVDAAPTPGLEQFHQ